ncbi:MAG: cell division protein FtsQ [Bacteroidia bacterium]|nr:cell division protein FtsQ [Bacteroidia bacterium]
MSDDHADDISKLRHKELSIKKLESRVKANLFVHACEIARNLSGDLFVEVTLSRPIARFIRQGKPDFYIDSLGKIMPLRDRYTARVLVVTQEDYNELPDFERKDRHLLEMLKYIYQDNFLKAQIAQVSINRKRDLTMYMQLGKQVVTFGKTGSFEEKLKKLKIFYKEILPHKGWDAYKRVNLKYDQQIICE